jgi:hypothetical protein
MKKLCILMLLALVQPATAQAVAEDEDEPLWYRVEVLIFRYLETAGETESWPDLPELSYPPLLRHLRPGLSAGDLQQEFELQRVEDAVPIAEFDLAWDKSAAQLQREYEETMRALAALSAPPILLGDDEGADSADPDTAVDPDSVTIPRAFVPIPAHATEFRAQARGIRLSRDKRLLYHQSWLQPLRSRERSLSVAVDGVIEEGDYPALQGSLLLYVSRYLHVETNLWINTRDAGDAALTAALGEDGSAPEADAIDVWRMPPPPLPPSAYHWTRWAFQVQLDAGFSDDIVLPPGPGSAFGRGAAPAPDSSTAPGATQSGLAGTPIYAAQAGVTGFDPAGVLQPIVITAQRIPVLDIEQFLAQTWYPFERAVPVQQKRRMRGGELHYLDHPLLGLILRVSPYEFEPFTPPPGLDGSLAGSSPGFPR